MSVRYVLVCNGCSATAKETSAVGVAMARMSNKGHGWTHPKPGQDFCAKCSAVMREEQKRRNPNGYV